MFRYDKEIDDWSKQMISGHEQIWGNQIGNNTPGASLGILPCLVAYLNSYLGAYGKEILKRFNSLTGFDYRLEDIGWYVNSIPVSLHSTGERLVSISASHQFFSYPTILIHEISHIYFCNYLRSVSFLEKNNINSLEEILSPAEENELKEIATVLVNEEFLDLISQPDLGYPDHYAIREEAVNRWRETNRNFAIWTINIIEKFKKGN